MPGIDRRIVRDKECPIIAKLGKKEKQCKTADGGLLVISLSLRNHSVTYDYYKQCFKYHYDYFPKPCPVVATALLDGRV